ncbi:MAG: metalloregulator ArsR/SmtB family transcription factor [Pseudomonadota bacterium]
MKLDHPEMFKVLSVDTRLNIIEILKSQGPLGAKNIAEQLGVTTGAVSQHLKILRQAGLVRSERKGYWIPYSIDEEALENCGQLLNQICTCGCKETCRAQNAKVGDEKDDLFLLIKRERELQEELQKVQAMIKEKKGE